MRQLAAHYERLRLQHPDDELCLVFDLDELLDTSASSATRGGTLAVIRWFSLLPRTHVAFVSDRPERLRGPTLGLLAEIGRPYRLSFDPDLVVMSPPGLERDRGRAIGEALRWLRSRGLRVVAVVANEPVDVGTMAGAADELADVLFVEPGMLPDLAELVSERDIAGRVELVWHGVNDPANLGEFLRSPVRWAEVDVRTDPLGRLVLRHDPFDSTPPAPGDRPLLLGECLGQVRAAGRGAKLDFKEGGEVVERALAVAEQLGFDDTSLWFNSTVECLGHDGFRELRHRYPAATMTCPVDFLGPSALAAPEEAEPELAALRRSGVDRLSLAWTTGRFHEVLDRFESAGWDVNVYALPDLTAFLDAALLLPRSLTADFNFPEWGYHGRGSGERTSGVQATG